MANVDIRHRGEYAAFPVAEYEERYARLRASMSERDLDAVLLTSKENVVFFSGLETVGWETKHRPLGLLLPLDGDPVLVLAETLAFVAEATSWVEHVQPWGGFKMKSVPATPVAGMIATIKRQKLERGRIGMELGYGTRLGMTISEYQELTAALPHVEFIDAAPACWDVRMVKSPAEIDVMRTVCRETSDSFEAGFRSIRSGMTERDLAANIFSEMTRRTKCKPAFIGIRAGRLKYNMLNVPPLWSNTLEPGDLVVVDGGAEYKDYRADMMRMAALGMPTETQRHFFDVDLAAMNAGLARVRAGVAAKEIPRACFDVIKDAGLGHHALVERVGHGLGMDVHEPPSLGLDNEQPLQAGMVLAVEPIFSDLPNYEIGNFAMEQNILVTETGYELLTPMDDRLWVIDI